jgi:hypothetical protein
MARNSVNLIGLPVAFLQRGYLIQDTKPQNICYNRDNRDNRDKFRFPFAGENKSQLNGQ